MLPPINKTLVFHCGWILHNKRKTPVGFALPGFLPLAYKPLQRKASFAYNDNNYNARSGDFRIFIFNIEISEIHTYIPILLLDKVYTFKDSIVNFLTTFGQPQDTKVHLKKTGAGVSIGRTFSTTFTLVY